MKKPMYKTLKYAVCFIIVPAIVGFALATIFVNTGMKPPKKATPPAKTPTIMRYKDAVLFLAGNYRITIYHAITKECDSSPDIGAGGRVANGGVPTGHWFANNRMPFGTRIMIPDLTGDLIWTCRDRMNSRYDGNHIDLLIDYRIEGIGIRNERVYVVK